ncbi:hypothetical protein ACTXPF_08580 [Glutamicibacter arilaitensis]
MLLNPGTEPGEILMRNRRQVHGPRFYSSAQSSSARWMAQVVITAQILAALWPSSV